MGRRCGLYSRRGLEAEGGGLRQLDVFCVDDDVVVADEECDADDKPDGTWECLATTVVVDAV